MDAGRDHEGSALHVAERHVIDRLGAMLGSGASSRDVIIRVARGGANDPEGSFLATGR